MKTAATLAALHLCRRYWLNSALASPCRLKLSLPTEKINELLQFTRRPLTKTKLFEDFQFAIISVDKPIPQTEGLKVNIR